MEFIRVSENKVYDIPPERFFGDIVVPSEVWVCKETDKNVMFKYFTEVDKACKLLDDVDYHSLTLPLYDDYKDMDKPFVFYYNEYNSLDALIKNLTTIVNSYTKIKDHYNQLKAAKGSTE